MASQTRRTTHLACAVWTQRRVREVYPRRLVGYTPGMKTAISIPNDVFDEAEALARRMKKSRSEIYSRAVREYVARHSADKVTEALDVLLSAEGAAADDFAGAAARRTLERSEW
jgi:hypothetical protein